MNSTRILRGIRNGSTKGAAGTVLLATLTACGGGSGSGVDTEPVARLDISGLSMVKSTSPNAGAGRILVNMDTTNNMVQVAAPTTATTTAAATSTATISAAARTTTAAATTTGPNATAPFACAAGAITCVEVVSTSAQAQASVPVTFGQPFKAGDWRHSTQGLVARDNMNAMVPIQADEISSHRDGTARFAVVNAKLSDLQPGERRIVNLFTGANNATPQVLPGNPVWNLSVEAKIFHQQVTVVTFGDRSGHTAGTPFQVGEKITMTIAGPVTESFQLTIDTTTAGGGFATLTRIAEAFQQLVNSQSPTYVGEKVGGGYEKLWLKTKNPSHGAFQVSFNYSGQAKITQSHLSNHQAPQTWAVNAQDLLKQQIVLANGNQGSAARRFHGPVASEFKLVAPFRNAATGATHDFLTARLDARVFDAGQRTRTNVIIENNWTFKENPRNISYEMTFKVNGTTVHTQPIFTHFHHARWQKVVWTGVEPKVQLRHHMRYFLDSRAVWNYDLGIKVSDATLDAEAARLAQARITQAAQGPMGTAHLNPVFGATGGRPEIGPLPKWTALYLITQDERARASMMAVADAAAAVPVHFRDENTDHPIDTIDSPNISVHTNSNNLPKSADPTTWSPDTAHQGSYAYVPYLLTGDNFYLDEAMFWATWNVFSMPASYRSFEKSLINRQQVRGSAWALRSIGEAFRMLPDDHAMKAHFRTVLDNNLAWYRQHYVTDRTGSPMGAIQHVGGNSTAPWQNDFVATVIALLAENNEPHAREVHDWFSRFTVGRFMNDESGFCAARAPGYYWVNADAQGSYLTRWSDLFAANYATDVGKACSSLTVTDGYPHMAVGYAAYARGMLGAAAGAQANDATAAYAKWKSMTPLMDAALAKEPNWAIIPR